MMEKKGIIKKREKLQSKYGPVHKKKLKVNDKYKRTSKVNFCKFFMKKIGSSNFPQKFVHIAKFD